MSEQNTTTRGKTIFRVEKNKDNPFVMIDRRPIENPDLSWRAKGVLTYLISRPDNWIVRLGDLVKRSPEGVYAVRAALRELTKAGHIIRREERDESGRFKQYVLEVREIPTITTPPTNLPQAVEPQAVDLTLNDTDSFTDTDFNGVPPMPLDWEIGHDKPITQLTKEQQFEREAKDMANLIDFQAPGAGALAYAFMTTRRMILPKAEAKRERKAAREMLDMGVSPSHVVEATRQLMAARDRNGKPLTIVKLFSVRDTAIGLAHAATQQADDPAAPRRHLL
jgi:hypothetical protein